MPRQPRCAYREGRQQCRRIGYGNPPLCDPHRALIEDQANAPSLAASLGTIVGKFIRGEPITKDDLRGAFVDGMRGGVRRHDDPRADDPRAAREPVGDGFDWAYEQLKRRQAQQQAEAAAAAARAAAALETTKKAIRELGFKPNQTLTIEMVNKRRRELARKHHPDRPGGSVEKMQKVNAAADHLVAVLEGGARVHP